MTRIHSYVVRYDSGFAPNPFYGICTLATCKPDIRKHAQIGDWIIGSGSDHNKIRRGGYLVYAMRVTEAITFDKYATDPRFGAKKPFRNGSRKQSCGDNIYYRESCQTSWKQHDSFHSLDNGSINRRHMEKDTRINRVLISDEFVYFGGEGPVFPEELLSVCKKGRGRLCNDNPKLIARLECWLCKLGVCGYQGTPYEWLTLRG